MAKYVFVLFGGLNVIDIDLRFAHKSIHIDARIKIPDCSLPYCKKMRHFLTSLAGLTILYTA